MLGDVSEQLLVAIGEPYPATASPRRRQGWPDWRIRCAGAGIVHHLQSLGRAGFHPPRQVEQALRAGHEVFRDTVGIQRRAVVPVAIEASLGRLEQLAPRQRRARSASSDLSSADTLAPVARV
ncbi:MAG: hypothetical protein M3Y17_11800, partial [Actinomycetota bacterium]|nr:hypothetical protein [Actinomycetota bacterium]